MEMRMRITTAAASLLLAAAAGAEAGAAGVAALLLLQKDRWIVDLRGGLVAAEGPAAAAAVGMVVAAAGVGTLEEGSWLEMHRGGLLVSLLLQRQGLLLQQVVEVAVVLVVVAVGMRIRCCSMDRTHGLHPSCKPQCSSSSSGQSSSGGAVACHLLLAVHLTVCLQVLHYQQQQQGRRVLVCRQAWRSSS
jgi:hypothetical protein